MRSAAKKRRYFCVVVCASSSVALSDQMSRRTRVSQHGLKGGLTHASELDRRRLFGCCHFSSSLRFQLRRNHKMENRGCRFLGVSVPVHVCPSARAHSFRGRPLAVSGDRSSFGMRLLGACRILCARQQVPLQTNRSRSSLVATKPVAKRCQCSICPPPLPAYIPPAVARTAVRCVQFFGWKFVHVAVD